MYLASVFLLQYSLCLLFFSFPFFLFLFPAILSSLSFSSVQFAPCDSSRRNCWYIKRASWLFPRSGFLYGTAIHSEAVDFPLSKLYYCFSATPVSDCYDARRMYTVFVSRFSTLICVKFNDVILSYKVSQKINVLNI